jgi:hypothetical protein
MTPLITDIITKIQRDKIDLGITLYDKASLSDISSFEQTMSLTLPDDIKTFYSFCNGFESAEDMFRIIPLNEIIEYKSNGGDTYLVEKKDFYIAEYMIYCDMWTLSVSEQNNNEYYIYNKVDNVITLTHSFAEFLDVFLTDGVFNGLYNWREKIESTLK